MIELIFPDGEVVTGTTFRETENALRASQWNSYPSRRAFRREMRRRAILWSGKRTVMFFPVRTSKLFLRSLAKVGMFRIEKTKERSFI